MTDQRHNDPDILESGVRELRQQGESQGPNSQALARTRDAMRVAAADQKAPGLGLVERIRLMTRARRPLLITGTAAAAFLIVVSAWMLLAPSGGASIAFADVRQQIEDAKTMTMNVTVELKGMPAPMKMKMYFKSPGLMRQEIETTISYPHATTQGATSAPVKEEGINIIDYANHKMLGLIPHRKLAITYEMKNFPAEAIKQAEGQNHLEKLKTAMAGQHEDLGEKTIDGVKAKGYRCKSEVSKQSFDMDIWVDATSGKPVLVEQTLPESVGGGKITMKDFELNPRLDDSLFDTKVPEGYTVQKQFVDFNVTEEDLTKSLGRLAKYCGGVFPKSITPSVDLIKKLEKTTAKLSTEEKQAMGKTFQKLMMFQVIAVGKGEFVYVGEGVKVGDKVTPILWYKAKDAKAYRVIYGDLHVEESAKAPKAPATQPVTTQPVAMPSHPTTSPADSGK